MKQKVLYISPNGYMGGAERFVVNINLGHVRSEKIESLVLFLNNGEAYTLIEKMGVKAFLLPFRLRFSRPWTFLKTVLYIINIVRREQVDTIHSTMAYSHILSFFVALFTNVKTVWFQHGPIGGLLDKIAVLLPIDIVLFNSNYTRDQHKKLWTVVNPKFGHKVISLGVEHKEVHDERVFEIRNQFLQNDKKIILGVAGRISSIKGYETLIKSMSILQREKPDLYNKCVVLVVGSAQRESDKNYELYLKTLVKDHGMQDAVFFLGHQTEIQNYLKAFDIFIHTTSIPEGFGLVVAEAMLQDTLVIGSSKGGVGDILINEKTGFTYDSVSSKAYFMLESILEKVLSENPNEENSYLLKIKENATKLIRESYSIEKMTDEVEEIYRGL